MNQRGFGLLEVLVAAMLLSGVVAVVIDATLSLRRQTRQVDLDRIEHALVKQVQDQVAKQLAMLQVDYAAGSQPAITTLYWNSSGLCGTSVNSCPGTIDPAPGKAELSLVPLRTSDSSGGVDFGKGYFLVRMRVSHTSLRGGAAKTYEILGSSQ